MLGHELGKSMKKQKKHKTQSKFVNLTLVIASVLLSLLAMELFVRFTPISDTLGWTRNESIKERIARIDKKLPEELRILGLGDSFSGWRDADGKNYLRFMEQNAAKNGNSLKVVNLSQAGTGVQHYRSNFHRYFNVLDPDVVTIGIYLGNDVECPVCTAPMQPLHEENNSIKNFIKRNSVLLNYLFRQGKYYVPYFRSGTYEHNLTTLKNKYGIKEEIVNMRLAKIDTKIIELSKSDLINPLSLPTALVYPKYYSELYLLQDHSEWAKIINCFLEYLSEFGKEIKEAGAEPIFIIIPDSIVVAKQYHSDYESLGFYVEDNLHNKSPIPLIERITSYLNFNGYKYIDLLQEMRSKNDNLYIPMDGHFNTSGHKSTVEIIFKELIKFGLINLENK